MPVKSSEKIKLTEDDKILITNEREVTMELNNFFSNAVIDLKSRNLSSLILRQKTWPSFESYFRYRNHPSEIGIVSEFIKECFSFNIITIEDALKEIIMLDSTKAKQATNIPV